MPQITVKTAFHYGQGDEVLRIEAGDQEVSDDIAAHAFKHGFAPEPKKTKPADKATDAAAG